MRRELVDGARGGGVLPGIASAFAFVVAGWAFFRA